MPRPVPSATLLAAPAAGCGEGEAYAPGTQTEPEAMLEQGCARCHGVRGGGRFGSLPASTQTEVPASEIASLIAAGKAIMPAFPQPREDQRRALRGYVHGPALSSGQ